MRGATLLIALLLSHIVALADGSPSDARLRVDMLTNGRFLINKGGGVTSIQIKYDVFGYEVNCAKTRILVWGKPKKLNKNNPQDSILTLVKLNSRNKPITIGFSKNIFGVEFLNDGVNAIILSDTEQFIDLTRAAILSQSDIATQNINSKPEECEAFQNKAFRKYKN